MVVFVWVCGSGTDRGALAHYLSPTNSSLQPLVVTCCYAYSALAFAMTLDHVGCDSYVHQGLHAVSRSHCWTVHEVL